MNQLNKVVLEKLKKTELVNYCLQLQQRVQKQHKQLSKASTAKGELRSKLTRLENMWYHKFFLGISKSLKKS